MVFLLDTNVISELRAGKPTPSPAVRLWAEGVAANQLYLAAVSILALEIGVPSDGAERPSAGSESAFLASSGPGAVLHSGLASGTTTALMCAAMHIPNRRPQRDAMIAATAKEHRYTVVSRNTDDFDGCGIKLLDPWLTS